MTTQFETDAKLENKSDQDLKMLDDEINLKNLPRELVKLARRNRPDLYVLAHPEFGNVDDGTRDTPDELRMKMHVWTELLINDTGVPLVHAKGSPKSRLTHVASEIKVRLLDDQKPIALCSD